MTLLDAILSANRKFVHPGAFPPLPKNPKKWIGAFGCPQENVADVVGKIRANPLIPHDVPIHGLIFSPNDGRLETIVNGYEAPLFISGGA